MVSQNAIPSKQHLGGSKPYVFSEHGVSMLSAVLKTEQAVEVSVKIIRAFVDMKKFIIQNESLFSRINALEKSQFEHKLETHEKFDKLFNAIEDKSIQPKQGIFYDGQIFDAYIFFSDLIKQAKKTIVLIDNYIDESTLIHLSSKANKSVRITILTQTITKALQLDIEKNNAQYTNIELKEFKHSHDRFLIIDDNVYHIGASLKDLGKKWFAFSLLESSSLGLMDKVENIILSGDKQ